MTQQSNHPTTQPPNILLLHTDQQRYDAIGALGGDHVMTPNLDRMVADGLTFTQAQTSSPFCMPARHDLLTGASARHHGYYQNQAMPIADYGLATLPRLLTEAGYQTIAVGKMHFHPEREHHGFSHMYLMEELPSTAENDAYVQYLQDHDLDVRCQHGVRPVFYPTPQVSRVPEEHHGSAWVAHKTIELLETKRDRPFFLWASWVGPHPPFYVPQAYLDMYEDVDFPPSHLTPAQEEERDVPPEKDVSRPWVRRFKQGYFARVTLIDKHVGRILDALAATGQLDNTLVIFTSDHGEMLGDRRIFSKTVPYQGSTHIPLILYGAGVDGHNKRAAAAANTWDVAATILDAAGVAPPDHPLIGENLLALNPDDTDRIVISHLYEGHRRWIAGTTTHYKFIHRFGDGSEELYDLAADPWERHNRVNDPALAATAARLREACLAFERDHGQPGTVGNDGFRILPQAPPKAHPQAMVNRSAVPWPFNWTQFPRWMDKAPEGAPFLRKEDLDAILDEMRDVTATRPDIHLPRDPAWREQVLIAWQAIGGEREALQALFDDLDEA
jgi:arylsulfatase A-like enzyme